MVIHLDETPVVAHQSVLRKTLAAAGCKGSFLGFEALPADSLLYRSYSLAAVAAGKQQWVLARLIPGGISYASIAEKLL